ncbi:MAG: hypothetical protein AB7G21_14435 [Dehalococcoidia bacterium]
MTVWVLVIAAWNLLDAIVRVATSVLLEGLQLTQRVYEAGASVSDLTVILSQSLVVTLLLVITRRRTAPPEDREPPAE